MNNLIIYYFKFNIIIIMTLHVLLLFYSAYYLIALELNSLSLVN